MERRPKYLCQVGKMLMEEYPEGSFRFSCFRRDDDK